MWKKTSSCGHQLLKKTDHQEGRRRTGILLQERNLEKQQGKLSALDVVRKDTGVEVGSANSQALKKGKG